MFGLLIAFLSYGIVILQAHPVVYSVINGNALFNCDAVADQGSEGLSLQWKKGETLSTSVLLIDAILGSVGGPYSETGQYHLNTRNGSLQIHHISSEDEGTYFCELLSVSNMSSAVDLKVVVPMKTLPILSMCGQPGNCIVSISPSQEVEFTCSVFSIRPAVELKFINGSYTFKNSISNQVQNRDRTLNVSCSIAMTIVQQGSFGCKAIGPAASMSDAINITTSWIQVKFVAARMQAPTINLCNGETNCTIYVEYQYATKVVCSIPSNDHQPQIYWTGNSEIFDSQSYSEEIDYTGELMATTAVNINYHQLPIRLFCHVRRFPNKGLTTSWVQLEISTDTCCSQVPEVQQNFQLQKKEFPLIVFIAVAVIVVALVLVSSLVIIFRCRKAKLTKYPVVNNGSVESNDEDYPALTTRENLSKEENGDHIQPSDENDELMTNPEQSSFHKDETASPSTRHSNTFTSERDHDTLLEDGKLSKPFKTPGNNLFIIKECIEEQEEGQEEVSKELLKKPGLRPQRGRNTRELVRQDAVDYGDEDYPLT